LTEAHKRNRKIFTSHIVHIKQEFDPTIKTKNKSFTSHIVHIKLVDGDIGGRAMNKLYIPHSSYKTVINTVEVSEKSMAFTSHIVHIKPMLMVFVIK